MTTVAEPMSQENSIQLTASAADRVREFMDRDGGIGLKLGVHRTGCSGWAYDVEIARAIEPGDHVFEAGDVTVVVPEKALGMVAGTTVDFVHDGLVREFRFRNPNVTGECGCGESFTVA
jgi:iron-sulfur cluster assembly protein